ncbi:MAG: DUF4845 domain-containing protein [Ideonella sp.]|jgi:hypothetical protein|nr:DUF4845 domain-containing protein [Ideonella sp.]MBL0149823.1 DUF4845 domain-containing protein [Ideonella sp.]
MKQHLRPRSGQRGVTMIGLLFWAILVGFAGYTIIRVVPTVVEYRAIRSAIDRIAASPPSTVAGVRAAFDRQTEIEQLITSITGKDLTITKENEKVVIAFAYDKEIELVAPVFLVIKYEGRSK